MPYIGKSPTQAVRQKYQYTATASQTTFSGSDANSLTLAYTDENYIDVTQNGVMLKGGGNDYTATTGTSVVLATGATANDVIEIIVYDVFAVADHVKKSGDIMTGQLKISTTDNSAGLLLESSDADAVDAPIIDLYRNSASPADDDDIGQIQFNGQNDAGEKILYASIFGEASDASDGTEDGAIVLNLEMGGVLRRMAKLGTDEHVFNTNGLDIDFRVRSDNNDHMLFVDAGNDHVNIGTSSDLGSTLNVNGEITCANANAGLLLVENAADAFGSNFTMRKSRNTTLNAHTVVQDDDVTGNINFQGSDGTDFHSTASIASAVDNTPGNNDMPGRLVFSTTGDGGSSPTERMRIDSSGNVMIGATSSTALLNVRGQTAPLAVMFNSDNSDKVILQMRHDFARGSQNATMIQFLNNDGDEKGSVKTTSTATSFNTSSDYRLKENVSYDWDATSRLKQLKPCRFNWISDETNTLVDGFLAHEVSSSVLQAVSGEKDAVDKDGKIKPQGIDQSKLVPLLTKALQESIARADALEARIKKLEDG